MKKTPLRILPLGGFGEVGKNMIAYEHGDHILIVDCGIMFPENDMLGIDYIIPDFSYLFDKAKKVRGIVMTHGHEDHIGAVSHLLEKINAPIYATPLTRGLLEVKLARGGKLQQANLNTIQPGQQIPIGVFQVEFFHVTHSIPDCVGLAIHTPEGLVVHTGDYKFDQTPVDELPTDFSRLGQYSQRKPILLLADSTNVEKPGWTPSERVVADGFDNAFRNARGRILVATFASHISRIKQVGLIAAKHQRKIALAGTSMVDNVRMARKLGYLDFPDDLVVPLDQALNMPDKEIVIVCTGSQGEPTSILGRLSTGSYRQFDTKPGDTIILSSHPIPGNEETVSRVINRLLQRGADVIYEAIAQVHVSGHPSQEEAKLLLNLVRPRYFMPMHGELRHLRQHGRLAQTLGYKPEDIAVVENGTVVEILNGAMRIGERIPGGYIFVDGSSVGEVSVEVMREREKLSRAGVVIVHADLDSESGQLIGEPDVYTRGFITAGESELVRMVTREAIDQALHNRENGELRKLMETAISSHLYSRTSRRPQVFVTFSTK